MCKEISEKMSEVEKISNICTMELDGRRGRKVLCRKAVKFDKKHNREGSL